jgi:hypothetical protein
MYEHPKHSRGCKSLQFSITRSMKRLHVVRGILKFLMMMVGGKAHLGKINVASIPKKLRT